MNTEDYITAYCTHCESNQKVDLAARECTRCYGDPYDRRRPGPPRPEKAPDTCSDTLSMFGEEAA